MEKKKRVLVGVGVGVGVEKKKLKSKRKKRGLLRNVLHYLKSDSYMYAPLLSLPPNRLPHSGKVPSEPKKIDAKRVVDRAVDYLKSDCYLYAPLVAPPPPATGPVERVSEGDLSRMPAKTVHQPTNKTDVAANENTTMKGCLLETRIACQQTLGCRETVEDRVYRNRRYSSVSGA